MNMGERRGGFHKAGNNDVDVSDVRFAAVSAVYLLLFC